MIYIFKRCSLYVLPSTLFIIDIDEYSVFYQAASQQIKYAHNYILYSLLSVKYRHYFGDFFVSGIN